MSIVLYHHPFTRAANVVWMLEELGLPYELRYVDIANGEQKNEAFLALNPMGKLPVITDGDVVVSESAAIALYLADRYSSGTLAPTFDDPARGTYLRWSLFAPAVIEPGSLAKANGWDFRPGNAGWGDNATMLSAIEAALSKGDWLLGDRFTMADVIFGGTLRYMLRFNMIEAREAFTAYAERLAARPAAKRSDARNYAIAVERGLVK